MPFSARESREPVPADANRPPHITEFPWRVEPAQIAVEESLLPDVKIGQPEMNGRVEIWNRPPPDEAPEARRPGARRRRRPRG
jgi:hypothetical protein